MKNVVTTVYGTSDMFCVRVHVHVRQSGVSLGEASLLQLATVYTDNAFSCLETAYRVHKPPTRTHIRTRKPPRQRCHA